MNNSINKSQKYSRWASKRTDLAEFNDDIQKIPSRPSDGQTESRPQLPPHSSRPPAPAPQLSPASTPAAFPTPAPPPGPRPCPQGNVSCLGGYKRETSRATRRGAGSGGAAGPPRGSRRRQRSSLGSAFAGHAARIQQTTRTQHTARIQHIACNTWHECTTRHEYSIRREYSTWHENSTRFQQDRRSSPTGQYRHSQQDSTGGGGKDPPLESRTWGTRREYSTRRECSTWHEYSTRMRHTLPARTQHTNAAHGCHNYNNFQGNN